ncbi:MAG: S9 family peptidase [Calditrichaeota bacterium]|nr:S9 family peptidase [Calditrichota bacterium]
MKNLKQVPLILAVLLVIVRCSGSAPETEDPYMWLEDVTGEKALNWVKSQNEQSLPVLKDNAVYQNLFPRLLENYNSNENIPYVSIKGDYLYNFWRDEQNKRGLWRRTDLKNYIADNTKWETVLDLDKLAEAESENWVYKGASYNYDNTLAMLRLSRGGADAVVIREFDLQKKEFVKDGFQLKEAKGSVDWIDNNTLYVQTDFGDGTLTTSGYARFVKEWKRGTDISEAKTVYEGNVDDVWVSASVLESDEGKYELINNGLTFYTYKQLIKWNGKFELLDIPENANLTGIFRDQMLIQLKNDWTVGGNTYKQGSLIGIRLDAFMNGDRNFTEIVVPDAESNIEGISRSKDILLVNMLKNVRSELYEYRFENNTWTHQKVDAPEFGTINLSSAAIQSNLYFFQYTSFISPSSLYMVNNGKVSQIKSLPAFFNSDDLSVDQYAATSKDGTKIPYFVVHKKDLQMNGKNPTLLYGYGGFQVSIRPGYSATNGIAWLEKGGVYVSANIRGGDEFGPKWHQASLKENRQRCYDDFIAVAEDLIAKKITSSKHLGIHGGSNGGLLVGAVFTQRPDLFNAVICAVPLLDMKRYNKLLAGASWMAEYGNPDIPEEWDYIKKYSPYQNVSADKTYPEVFFTTSTRDDRVHPGHARKMVAKMEAQGHKVFYYENTEGGHAGAADNEQSAMVNALKYSYLWIKLNDGRFLSTDKSVD